MRYELNIQSEPFETDWEFDEASESFDTELADMEWEEEAGRRRRPRARPAVRRAKPRSRIVSAKRLIKSPLGPRIRPRPPIRPPGAAIFPTIVLPPISVAEPRPPQPPAPAGAEPAGTAPAPAAGPPTQPSAEPPSAEPSAEGSEHVRWVQDSLNRILGLRLPVDGIMGPEVRSAVRSFQERQGLPITGLVGPDTERALIAGKGGQSSGAGATKPDEPGMTEPPEPAATPREPGMTEPAEPAPASSPAEFDFEWEGTLDPEIATPAGAVDANRLLARRIGWANGHEVEAHARDTFDTEWDENENRPVADIDWCQMRQTIARIARAEERRWTRPDSSKFREDHPSRLSILESYWRTVPGFTTAAAAGAAARESANNNTAWSAAFVCFVMHTAGVRQVHGFEFSRRHITYTVGALRNRQRSDQNRVFWLADSIEVQDEAAPETGDLLCFNRRVNGTMTHHSYDSLHRDYWLGGNQNRVPTGSSHCSIVIGKVERNGRWFIQTIGGNETAAGSGDRGVTVGLREIPLDRFGGIPNPQAHNIFGIIKLIGC